MFKRAGIEEWRDKTVLLCCDSAAVNHDKKNGVAAKLKDDAGHLVAVHPSPGARRHEINQARREAEESQ